VVDVVVFHVCACCDEVQSKGTTARTIRLSSPQPPTPDSTPAAASSALALDVASAMMRVGRRGLHLNTSAVQVSEVTTGTDPWCSNQSARQSVLEDALHKSEARVTPSACHMIESNACTGGQQSLRLKIRHIMAESGAAAAGAPSVAELDRVCGIKGRLATLCTHEAELEVELSELDVQHAIKLNCVSSRRRG